MLESIYYVITWACNRVCAHCYDARFRPYPDGERSEMLARQAIQMPKIIGHFPDRLSFRDLSDQRPDGTFPMKAGRVILAGGEVLLPDVREKLLYPCLTILRDKYGRKAKTVIQTGGDLLDERVLEELLVRDVWMVSVSSMVWTSRAPLKQSRTKAVNHRLPDSSLSPKAENDPSWRRYVSSR